MPHAAEADSLRDLLKVLPEDRPNAESPPGQEVQLSWPWWGEEKEYTIERGCELFEAYSSLFFSGAACGFATYNV